MPIFADSSSEVTSFVTAVIAGVIAAVMIALEIQRRLKDSRERRDAEQSGFVTGGGGRTRLVTADTYKEERERLREELRRGSDRMEAQERSLSEIKLQIEGLRGDIKEALANQRTHIADAINRHVNGPLHRGD